jgi:DNA-binding NtrC family response regulator
LSSRRGQPFLRYQPQFGSADLVSSELFGHQRGAFTGAIDARKGLIEEANRGTLFIDEVAELPRETQILLLEVLQNKSFRRLGSNRDIASDFRLVTATNVDPAEMVKKGQMRADFFHRIAHLTIELPPLRERREDIAHLADSIMKNTATRERLAVTGIAPAALSRLVRFSWPGNVRQLAAVIEGATFHAHYQRRKIIEVPDLSLDKDKPLEDSGGVSFRERVQDFERRLVEEALQRCGGNQSEAARLLALDRNQLRRVLKR